MPTSWATNPFSSESIKNIITSMFFLYYNNNNNNNKIDIALEICFLKKSNYVLTRSTELRVYLSGRLGHTESIPMRFTLKLVLGQSPGQQVIKSLY